MRRILVATVLFCLTACGKNPENTLDEPEYKTMTAHSWQSDSVFKEVNGRTIVSYSSTGTYELLHFYFPYCGFVRYENGVVADSVRNWFGYQPGVIHFFPDTSGVSAVDYANIKVATDSLLVLERHASADSAVPVVVTYYHAK